MSAAKQPDQRPIRVHLGAGWLVALVVVILGTFAGALLYGEDANTAMHTALVAGGGFAGILTVLWTGACTLLGGCMCTVFTIGIVVALLFADDL